MITDTLSKYPEIGIGSTIGTLTIHWLGIINSLLNMVSLIIGITVGLTTLYLQIQKVRRKSWKKYYPKYSCVGVIYDMGKLKKMKKDIDKELPAVGKMLGDTAEDLPNKGDRFLNAVISGIDKFFSPN